MTTNDIHRRPPSGFGFIYKITSPSGKSYIGQTVYSIGTRVRGHRANRKKGPCCTAIFNAVKKYGCENMSISVLGMFPISELDSEERKAIQVHNSLHPNGYNLTEGGVGVRPILTPEMRRRLGDSRRGKHCTDAHKAAISKAHTGRIKSESERLKLSIGRTGKLHSLESRRKISEALKARKWKPSPEHLAKMIAARHPNYIATPK